MRFVVHHHAVKIHLIGSGRSGPTQEARRFENTGFRERPVAPTTQCGPNRLALTDFDQDLIERCLRRLPGAWEEFVDRFASVVLQIVRHTLQVHGEATRGDRVQDLVAAAFATLLHDDFAVLRRFRRKSSLASFLAVTARRTTLLALRSAQPEEKPPPVGPANLATPVAAIAGPTPPSSATTVSSLDLAKPSQSRAMRPRPVSRPSTALRRSLGSVQRFLASRLPRIATQVARLFDALKERQRDLVKRLTYPAWLVSLLSSVENALAAFLDRIARAAEIDTPSTRNPALRHESEQSKQTQAALMRMRFMLMMQSAAIAAETRHKGQIALPRPWRKTPSAGIAAPILTEGLATRAQEIWSDYQQSHDLSEKAGQTAGIDPATGRIWFGESVQGVIAERVADAIDSPLYFVRVESSVDLHEAEHR